MIVIEHPAIQEVGLRLILHPSDTAALTRGIQPLGYETLRIDGLRLHVKPTPSFSEPAAKQDV
jgi:hypothetical protein